MNLYFVIPFLFLLGIFQATAAPQIRIAGGSLNLLLLCVMSWEQIEARGEGYSWAFIGGLALDLLSGGPFGASVLGLLAATFVVALTLVVIVAWIPAAISANSITPSAGVFFIT